MQTIIAPSEPNKHSDWPLWKPHVAAVAGDARRAQDTMDRPCRHCPATADGCVPALRMRTFTWWYIHYSNVCWPLSSARKWEAGEEQLFQCREPHRIRGWGII